MDNCSTITWTNLLYYAHFHRLIPRKWNIDNGNVDIKCSDIPFKKTLEWQFCQTMANLELYVSFSSALKQLLKRKNRGQTECSQLRAFYGLWTQQGQSLTWICRTISMEADCFGPHSVSRHIVQNKQTKKAHPTPQTHRMQSFTSSTWKLILC